MSWILCLLFIACVQGQSSETDECDGKIADSCFQDVADDLHLIFDPVNNFLDASNMSALADLCSAWTDSLNCVGTIIDDSCSESQGRDQFDTWNEGLKRVVEFLCLDEMQNLQAVAQTVHCWSILQFIQCTEATAQIASVDSLLKTPLRGTECDLLKTTVHNCNLQAASNSCPQSAIVQRTLESAMHAFFSDVQCMVPYSKEMASSVIDKDPQLTQSVSSYNSPSSWIAVLVSVVVALFIGRTS